MKNRKLGRKPNIQLKEKVWKLAQADMSYQEIADVLKLNSWQLAQYHFKSYPQFVVDKRITKE